MQNQYAPSPENFPAADSLVLMIDMQQRLLPSVCQSEAITARAELLLSAAQLFDVPCLATEQYPEGLGPTHPTLAELVQTPLPKLTFSCCGAAGLMQKIADSSRRRIVLCGIETHICVQQTALDLQAQGYTVYLAADAAASRHQIDHSTALARLNAQGINIVTAEAQIFQWCQTAEHTAFKRLQKLVKQAESAR